MISGSFTQCSEGIDIIGSVDADLSLPLVPDYIVEIPMDPQVGTIFDTGYTICEEATGRINISAPNAEGTTISVSR